MSLQARFKKPPVPQTVVSINGPRLLNLKQAAEYMGVHLWTMRELVRNREIPLVPVGKSRRHVVDRIDLDRYIERVKPAAA